MTVIELPTRVMPRPLPPVPPSKPRRPGGAGRDPRPGAVTTVPALRLTRRGAFVLGSAAGLIAGLLTQITHTAVEAVVAFAPLFN